MITALCGGVGGSKLALGLYRSLPPDELTVIVNTADDLEFCGLNVCPDLDTVMYTLSELAQRDVGWGVEGDTRNALTMLKRYGAPTWFGVGDGDLATHVYRTWLLRQGLTLTEVTGQLCAALGIRASILPMTDERVATHVRVAGEWIEFQDYFVRRRHSDPVEAIEYRGIEAARPSDAVIDAIEGADLIILVNSNPVLSILPILALPGVNDLLVTSLAPRVAVSPIVGLTAVTGPAGDLMHLLGQPSTALGVANAYAGVVNGVVIDRSDEAQRTAIEVLGLTVLTTGTIMKTEEDRIRLAEETVSFARSLT